MRATYRHPIPIFSFFSLSVSSTSPTYLSTHFRFTLSSFFIQFVQSVYLHTSFYMEVCVCVCERFSVSLPVFCLRIQNVFPVSIRNFKKHLLYALRDENRDENLFLLLQQHVQCTHIQMTPGKSQPLVGKRQIPPVAACFLPENKKFSRIFYLFCLLCTLQRWNLTFSNQTLDFFKCHLYRCTLLHNNINVFSSEFQYQPNTNATALPFFVFKYKITAF